MSAHENLALRPFLAADAQDCALIFRAAIEFLTEDDYDDDQRAAWAAAGEDVRAFGSRLAAALTLVVTIDQEIVGFASLKADKIDMLYVDPRRVRAGVATTLVAALEKLAVARKVESLSADVSDTARPFFEARGFVAARRNTVDLGGVWLGNTTMFKVLAPGTAGDAQLH